MHKHIVERATLAGLFVLVLMTGFVGWHVVRLGENLKTTIQQGERIMQVITQTVTRQNGDTTEVSTTRIAGESLADWQARHDEAVDHFKNS